MLKSYKKLDRWYDPLDPEGETDTGRTVRASDQETVVVAEDDGPARYPDYIAEAGSATAEPDAPAPAELSGRRTEFTGGWSDWVDTPGAEREADLLNLPGLEDDAELTAPPRIGRAPDRPPEATGDTHRRRTFAVLAAAVVLLVAAAAVVLYLLTPDAPRAAAPDDGAGVHFTADSVGAGKCPDESDGPVVRGSGPGGTDSGPAAILRFQHAYYVQRSGTEARAVVAPDAPVSSTEVIQAGIDSVAPGTGHCVRIVALAENRYAVDVTEFPPNGEPATYSRQTVTTAVVDGRTLITGISAG